jgi:hypothetical protein
MSTKQDQDFRDKAAGAVGLAGMGLTFGGWVLIAAGSSLALPVFGVGILVAVIAPIIASKGSKGK